MRAWANLESILRPKVPLRYHEMFSADGYSFALETPSERCRWR